MDGNNPFHVCAFYVLLRALRDYVGAMEIQGISKARASRYRRHAYRWLTDMRPSPPCADKGLSCRLICEALDIDQKRLIALVEDHPEVLNYNIERALAQNKPTRHGENELQDLADKKASYRPRAVVDPLAGVRR